MSDSVCVSLSTSWLSQRHSDGFAMLEEVAQLGFEYVELGHGIGISLVPGILDALDRGIIKVSSTHNFCPLPPGVAVPSPNYYEPSAGLESGRQQWLRHTLNSIAFARRVGVRRMVAHMGSMRFFFGQPDKKLSQLARGKTKEQLAQDKEFLKERARVMKKLRKQSPKYYKRLREGLEKIAEAATAAELRVGMENRDGVLELPLEADWKEFLQSVETMPFAGTWFDIGHAYKKERLGLMSAQEVLDVTDRNRVGFHLHNVTANGHDHQGMLEEGIVDFSILKGRIKPGDPVVLEFSSRVSTDDVKRSLEFAKKLVSESLSTN